MFIGYGKIEIKKGIRVKIGLDFLLYYQKLINYYHYNTLKNQLPAYDGHISIVLPAFHKNVDYREAKGYDGESVEFEYDPKNIKIGSKSIWLPVDLPIGWEIKNKLKVFDEKFLGYHVTLVNWKKI